MKSLLEEGSTCLCGARRQVGVDMPPLPDNIWKGVGFLLLTEEQTFSGTFSETETTLTACDHAQAGWSIPENEPTTTAAEPRNGTIRWYDPITGRWLSKDPIGISGGLNQYQAFLSNPVNYRDPFGLCSDSVTYEFVPRSQHGGWYRFWHQPSDTIYVTSSADILRDLARREPFSLKTVNISAHGAGPGVLPLGDIELRAFTQPFLSRDPSALSCYRPN